MTTNTNNDLSVFELLNLRSEWEQIVSNFKLRGDQYKYHGTISNLKQFVKTGHVNNRFRDRFDRAMEIAHIILEAEKWRKNNKKRQKSSQT